MAWGTPMTAVAQQVFLASQWNTNVRDNLNETLAGKATTAGRWFSSDSANTILERSISSASVATAETRSSASFGDLATVGAAVTVTTSTAAMVFWGCQMSSASASAVQLCSVMISGATTISASDNWAAQCDGVAATQSNRLGGVAYFGTGSTNGALTAGSNTFTMKYRSNGVDLATFSNREIIVMAL